MLHIITHVYLARGKYSNECLKFAGGYRCSLSYNTAFNASTSILGMHMDYMLVYVPTHQVFVRKFFPVDGSYPSRPGILFWLAQPRNRGRDYIISVDMIYFPRVCICELWRIVADELGPVCHTRFRPVVIFARLIRPPLLK